MRKPESKNDTTIQELSPECPLSSALEGGSSSCRLSRPRRISVAAVRETLAGIAAMKSNGWTVSPPSIRAPV